MKLRGGVWYCKYGCRPIQELQLHKARTVTAIVCFRPSTDSVVSSVERLRPKAIYVSC